MSAPSANMEWFLRRVPEEIDPAGITSPALAALVRLLTSGEYNGARLISAHQGDDDDGAWQALRLEVYVELGQAKKANDIRTTEPVTLLVAPGVALPLAYPTRSDFPQNLPHLNIGPPELGRSMCLYDAAPEDVLRTFTPPRLLERIRWWLEESAYGRLHGDDQPFDPVFANAQEQVVLPARLEATSGENFVAVRRSVHDGAPFFLCPRPDEPGPASTEDENSRSVVIFLESGSSSFGDIICLPRDLAELKVVYERFGTDLIADLTTAFRELAKDGLREKLKAQQLFIIVRTPSVDSAGKRVRMTERIFLACEKSVESVALALGTLVTANNFVGPLLRGLESEGSVGQQQIEEIRLAAADVHRSFAEPLARAASGWTEASDAQVLLIGAGALGSQIALACARAGHGRWTIIDHDFLLPHNLARHALLARHVGTSKAEALACEINDLFGHSLAVAERLEITPSLAPGDCSKAFLKKELVIDASASVSVGRWIANQPDISAPAVSIFLSPSGDDLVVLAERKDRSVRLDHIEMLYYWRVIKTEALHDHLCMPGIVFSGGCRSPSFQISQAQMGVFSSIAADFLYHMRGGPAGSIQLWRKKSSFSVEHMAFDAETFIDISIGRWFVSIRTGLIEEITKARETAAQRETGGILIGGWDRQFGRIYVVGASDAPEDSVEAESHFVRGTVGVFRTISDVERLSAGNLTYLGEWHTHPDGVRAEPSIDDEKLLRWIGDAVEHRDVPGVMLIAGDDGVRCRLWKGGEVSEELM